MKKSLRKLKGFMSFSLIIFIAVALIGASLVVDAKKKSSSSTYAAGDNIAFGTLDGNIINWTILTYDETTGIAFLVSRKTLNSYSINDYRTAINMELIRTGQGTGYVPWANNYWRGWLNQVFYATAFTDAERAMIQKTDISVENSQTSLMNFYHDTTLDDFYVKNGVKNSLNLNIYNNQVATSDYIFFLSTDEYTAYKDTMKYENTGTWPLRTNSFDDPVFGLFVNDTSKLVEKWGYYAGTGIRPAMRVQLTPPKPEETEDSTTTKSTTTDSTTKASTTSDTSTSKTDTSSADTKTATAATTTSSSKESSSSSASGGSSRKYANNGTNIGNITLPDDASYTMSNGATAQVALNMDYLNSTDKQYTITYTSSDASVFTVDSSGVITAAGKGTGTLSVRMKKSNGKVYSMSCRIDVN